MLVGVVIFCVALEAIFTALEVAIGAVARTRLRNLAEAESDADEKRMALAKRATRTLQILENAPRLTLTFITVTSLSMWTATSLLTWLALSGNWPLWILPLALAGVLFVAEVLPVLIAAPRAESLALAGGGLLQVAGVLLAPLLWVIGSAANLLSRIFGARRAGAPQVTEDELRSALAAAEEEGAIESGERALLEGAMDFRAKLVREVMTPRLDIVGVRAETGLSEILQTALAEGHSRLPVYEGSRDKIVGIVSTKDLIPYVRHAADSPAGVLPESNLPTCARDIVRPAFFVPENKRIAATLDDLRRERTLMAIVVDDDGATAGLITLEDVLEEIVGDIQDESDQEEPELEIIGENSLRAAAGVTVREVERFWEKSFRCTLTLKDNDEQDADDTISLAALALHLFDGVPETGHKITAGILADGQSVGMEILAMDGPRIQHVQLAQMKTQMETNLET
jgi:CBS domain containing-hemolysin-like protein